MKLTGFLLFIVGLALMAAGVVAGQEPQNPRIDYAGFTEESLRKLIPEKHTRILIYCNNNFSGEPRLLAPKAGLAALNIPVFITLHAYGYTNVHELAPLLDIKTTKIPFAGESAK